MYMCNWITLLYTWNYHNAVNQLYSNIKLKVKETKYRKKFKTNMLYDTSMYLPNFQITWVFQLFLTEIRSGYPEKSSQGRVFLFFGFFFTTPWGILVPGPELEPMPPAAEAWNPSYWTTREVLRKAVLISPRDICQSLLQQ